MRMWMLPPEILCKKHLLGDISYLGSQAKVKANLDYNMVDLANRCPECAERMRNYENKADK